jgi:LPXTG-site transpeptidase (sortase) family protein
MIRGINKTFLGRIVSNVYNTAHQRPITFSVVWVIMFFGLFVSAESLNVVPHLDTDTAQVSVALADTEISNNTLVSINDAPVRIIIDSIGVDTVILNPQSRDIDVLNDALLGGVVHYPGSGDLEDNTNMFLFGHSTSIPIVRNENYKLFSNLSDLKAGDIIRVQSVDKEYRYRVGALRLVSADDGWVEFKTGKKQLTLSTCNVFGQKQDRYVVASDFIGSFLLK